MNSQLKLRPLMGAMMLGTLMQTEATLQAIQAEPPTIKSTQQNHISGQLVLAVGAFDPTQENLTFGQTGVYDTPSTEYGIVQFHAHEANQHWLKSQGFEIMQSLPSNAFVINWKSQNQAVLESNPNIRWHGAFRSAYKISPNLWRQHRSALTDFQLSVKTFANYPVNKLQALIRKFAPDAQLIQSNIPAGDRRIAIQVPTQRLEETLNQLAATEAVQWINLYHPEKLFNSEAVAAVQATSDTTNTPIFDQGLYGTGQIVGVSDSGLDHNEDWFAHHDDGSGVVTALTAAENTTPPQIGTISPNNKVIGYWVMPGAASYDHGTNHGTHVAGSVAGDRANCVGSCNGETPSVSSPTQSGYDNDDGMAPNAQLLFQDIGSSQGFTGAGSSPMWEQAYAAGARIHSNSYGASTHGEYVSSDQNADRSLRELDDMIIVIAAGNDDGFDNDTASPGNAKNALTVAALGHGNSASVAGFSNRGLTDDGRLKPDIGATGSSIQSAAGNTNNSNTHDTTPSRTTKSGTSMSTPITSGSLALLRQYFTDGFYPTGVANVADSLIPSGQLMKSMILNGTNTDVGFNDKGTGWGRVWLENTLYFTGDDRRFKFWDVTHESGLSTGENLNFSVDVTTGEEFRVTLAWYDLPGPTGSGITLVNDINLTVTAPNNDTFLGNVFSGDISTTGGSADTINTVEQVRLTAPATGTYQISVSGQNVPGDGSYGSDRQGFALVVSGDLSSNSPTPVGDPANLSATSNGASGVGLSWDAAADADYYEVYRSDGTCGAIEPGSMRFLATANSNTHLDDTTVGGYDYAYTVRAFNSDGESALTNCDDISSEQNCPIPPEFNGNTVSVTNITDGNCGIQVAWDPATTNCPGVDDIFYNIHGSNTHNFVPAPSNQIALISSLAPPNATFNNLESGVNYYYRIIANNNGNNSPVSRELISSPIGSGDAGIGTMGFNTGSDDTGLSMGFEIPWSVSNDAASNGTLSYRSTAEGTVNYSSNTCARLYSPTISIPASGGASALLAYQARYVIEDDWDGVVVEVSTDGGNNWIDLPPLGGYPGDFSQTGNPAINACGYSASQGAINGNTGGSFNAFSHDLSAYQGQDIQVRWSFSTDPGFEAEGIFIDEISFENVTQPVTCGVDLDLIFEDGFE